VEVKKDSATQRLQSKKSLSLGNSIRKEDLRTIRGTQAGRRTRKEFFKKTLAMSRSAGRIREKRRQRKKKKGKYVKGKGRQSRYFQFR